MGRIKQKVIATDLFQMITARLHQHKRRKELINEFSYIIEKFRGQKNNCDTTSESSTYIWLCWWQGRDKMGPLVKECCDRIERFNPDKQVVLITEDNMDMYVSFPQYIMEKYRKGIITKTHMSDLLRTELLAQYGGIWMDATIYTFGAIPERFYEKSLYTGRCKYNTRDVNVSRNRWTSYFWKTQYPGHILFCFLRDFWYAYWEKYEILIEYFLIDYVIDLGYRTIPLIKKELDAVDINGCCVDPWVLLKNLQQDYSDELLASIERENWMQKLSYRGEEYIQQKAANPDKTVYKILFLDIEKNTQV